ncbi:hypothetical protein VPH35_116654 [Triticum aestivum]|uniref:Uncharacterized protein n=1 Tax=Aegilops tauschii subsp. strangulata TaxID=200361 RepID=A0A453NQ73_AEGTS
MVSCVSSDHWFVVPTAQCDKNAQSPGENLFHITGYVFVTVAPHKLQEQEFCGSSSPYFLVYLCLVFCVRCIRCIFTETLCLVWFLIGIFRAAISDSVLSSECYF